MSFFVEHREDSTQRIFADFLEDMQGREDYLSIEGFSTQDNVFVTTTNLTCDMFKKQERELNLFNTSGGESLRATQLTQPIEAKTFGEPIDCGLILESDYKYGVFVFQHNPKAGFHYVLNDTIILSKTPQGLKKYLTWFLCSCKVNKVLLDDTPLCVTMSYENENKIMNAFVPQDSKNISLKDGEYLPQIEVNSLDEVKDLVIGYLDKLLPVQEKENNL